MVKEIFPHYNPKQHRSMNFRIIVSEAGVNLALGRHILKLNHSCRSPLPGPSFQCDCQACESLRLFFLTQPTLLILNA